MIITPGRRQQTNFIQQVVIFRFESFITSVFHI